MANNDFTTRPIDPDSLDRVVDYLEQVVEKLNFGVQLTHDERILFELVDGLAERITPESIEKS